jgi:Flp pilus assembly protein TadD
MASVAPQETISMEAMSAPQDQALDPPPSFRRSPIPRYTRLVQRLQTAVVRGDAQTADRLLDEFATVKGQGHPYLAKIKAYRLLLAGEYGAAEPLLMQVLAQDEMDRDAQMNMAVVEANTGRQDSARRRVARLVARFPEDETIAAMGRQLN